MPMVCRGLVVGTRQAKLRATTSGNHPVAALLDFAATRRGFRLSAVNFDSIDEARPERSRMNAVSPSESPARSASGRSLHRNAMVARAIMPAIGAVATMPRRAGLSRRFEMSEGVAQPGADRFADNAHVAEVLVELPGGEGIIRGDDGAVEFTHDVREVRGQRLQPGRPYEPVVIWLFEESCLVGGLLPPGAATAEVVDEAGRRVDAAVGSGAYVAALDQPVGPFEPVVLCRDASGAPVRRPLPGEYPSTPVTDTAEPCPACGSVDWEECVPNERWRGGRSGPDGARVPSPIVVCRVCGHEEREGSIMRYEAPDEDDAVRTARIARWRAEAMVQKWYRDALLLRAVTFPLYAAADRPAQISVSRDENDDLVAVTIAHTETEGADLYFERATLEVTTATRLTGRDTVALARDAIERWAAEESRDEHAEGLSDAALTLYFRSMHRRRRAAAHAAAVSETQVTIDGSPQAFLTVTTPGGSWAAVRHHDDLTITVAGRDIDPASLMLEPIADPRARLLGPEPAES